MIVQDMRGTCRGCDQDRVLFGPPGDLRTVSHRGRSPVDRRVILGERCLGAHRAPREGTVRRVTLPEKPRRTPGPSAAAWVASAAGVEPRTRGDLSEEAFRGGVCAVLSTRLVADGATPLSAAGRRIEVPLTADMLRAIASVAREVGAVYDVEVESRAALRVAEVVDDRLVSDPAYLDYEGTPEL